ncbi:MAG: sulfate reduction electron transfer complex DsrMKJOP subunit DsrM, partial [Proteobacteria bacterium]|nr:sulfate reduction electron transfer complex DsrMKJOP subunit DsrM [Pseudomonadota bacterium]
FGVVMPYTALVIFITGFIYRIITWARSPVPFSIPTVCGQAKSLPWIKANNTESPYTAWGVLRRMVLEICFFRSLFRNDCTELKEGQKLLFNGNKGLWLAGLVFHWSLLVILIRHFRLFLEPIPSYIAWLQRIDGIFEIALPALLMTDICIIVALLYLFFRRVTSPQVRYISLPADYFALLLVFGICISGMLLRYFYKVDIMEIKRFALGIVGLHPVIPKETGLVFYVHLFLVSTLFAYFPFSKLMHMGGVFLSPTRNLKNDSRMKRHVNPWDYPVAVRTYEEWEDIFREAMKEAGLPTEKER